MRGRGKYEAVRDYMDVKLGAVWIKSSSNVCPQIQLGVKRVGNDSEQLPSLEETKSDRLKFAWG